MHHSRVKKDDTDTKRIRKENKEEGNISGRRWKVKEERKQGGKVSWLCDRQKEEGNNQGRWKWKWDIIKEIKALRVDSGGERGRADGENEQ